MPPDILKSLGNRQSLTLMGGAFVLAANAVAFGSGGYPFISMAFVALLGLSLLATTVLFVPFSFRKGGRAAAFAIGATYFLDVMFVGGSRTSATMLILLAGSLTYLIAWRESRAIVAFTATAIGVCTVFTLPQQALTSSHLRPQQVSLAEPTAGGTGRPFVHIILDEMGTLALMPEGPFYDGLKRRMIADYRKRGFDLFYDTRSVAGATQVSLGNVYADTDRVRDNFSSLRDQQFTFGVARNRELDALTKAGYAISVLQNSFLKICQPNTMRCMTYARSGDGAAVLGNTASIARKVAYALRGFNDALLTKDSVRSSIYYRLLARAKLGMALPSWQLYLARPPLTVDLMKAFTKALAHIRPGESVILHFLVPHFPYVLDAGCSLRNPEKARAPLWVSQHTLGDFDMAATERAYWQQAACAHGQLMAMIDAILSSPAGRDAVILVHGDHGSRVLKMLDDPIHQAATEEERDYALLAHFAVRGAQDWHDQLAKDNKLRDRVGIILNEVVGSLSDPGADDVMTSGVQ